MRELTRVTAVLAILLLCYPAISTRGQTQKTDVIRQAARSYYGLRKSGLVEFKATITPTWEVVLGRPLNPDRMKLLKGLKFTMSFAANDEVKVNHEATFPAPDADTEAAYKGIFGGMDQVITGFFETWDLFMVNSPFPPPNSDFELKDLGTGYLLTYKDGSDSVATTMTKDFSITEIKVATAEFRSAITPQFSKTESGYVLVGYQANYEGLKAPGKIELNMQIDYQTVSGLKLPERIRGKGILGSESYETELVFSEVQATKR